MVFSTPAFTTALSNDSDTSMAASTAASVTAAKAPLTPFR